MPDARNRRTRLYHPEGGHTSTELNILSEPAARALAIARLEAEAEDRRREAEMFDAASRENRRRDLVAQMMEYARTRRGEPPLCPPPPPLRAIAQAVAEFYGVTVLDMASRRRTAVIVRPRQVFCYLARKLTFQSFPQIGQHLGKRDHTTVLYAFNKISCLLHEDAKLAADLVAIRQRLEGI